MDENRKLEYDKAYMRMALALAQLSHAVRNKVGCLIVSEDGQIVSQGYNGMPHGMDNCCEDKIYKYIPSLECKNPYKCAKYKDGVCDKNCFYADPSKEYTLVTKPEVLHAESNAISKCAKWNSSTNGATCYVTLSPCVECSKLIIQSGIKKVCYKDLYRNTQGLDFLKQAGIEVKQIDI